MHVEGQSSWIVAKHVCLEGRVLNCHVCKLISYCVKELRQIYSMVH